VRTSEIAKLVNGTLIGQDKEIKGISSIELAGETDITYFTGENLPETKAGVVLVKPSVVKEGVTLIQCSNPKYAFAIVAQHILKTAQKSWGISQLAYIDKCAEIGDGVTIGPFSYIGRASIGKNVTIYPQVYIGDEVEINDNTVILPQAVILDRVKIGKNVLIFSGARIGIDGFGFAQDKGRYKRLPQIGGVIIEDDVEIGANTIIERATFKDTIIKRGTKVHNLVEIAHNVEVGENTMIIAQTGIAGSVKIGRNVVIAGQVGIKDHITIGDRVMIGGQAGVTRSVPADTKVSGYPAREHSFVMRVYAMFYRLPELFKCVKILESKLKLK